MKSLNKQIKDKTEQIERLDSDLTKDSRRKTELESKMEELTGEQVDSLLPFHGVL